MKRGKKIKESKEDKTANDNGYPQVCFIDFEQSIVDYFREIGYRCETGSLGKKVIVPNKKMGDRHFIKPNHHYPSNLHEYDAVIVNMEFNEKCHYETQKDPLGSVTGPRVAVCVSEFPEKVFNPRPIGTYAISDHVKDILKRRSVVIIFADRIKGFKYKVEQITSGRPMEKVEQFLDDISFYEGFPYAVNKSGKKMNFPGDASEITQLLLSYSGESEYRVVFDKAKCCIDGKEVEDEKFTPLLFNGDGEIISFSHVQSEGIVFIFPCIKDKKGFLNRLFKDCLPEMIPELFPFSSQFGWVKNDEFLAPGEERLNEEEKSIEIRYLNEIKENKKRRAKIKEEFKFMYDLLTESGEKLVSAVEAYFKWAGFQNVVNSDERKLGNLEEDIQIVDRNRLLVVEVKGIGGTSTDNHCSQVNKIKNRRAEEKENIDVYGLYIVNHQRYMHPHERNNPPFSEEQIKDAKRDRRGLITTCDLYNACFMANDGILLKDEIRESLFEYGLIELKPRNLISLGKPKKYYNSETVIILDIDGVRIKKGTDLFVEKDKKWERVEVVSIQINGNEVDEADNGEIGIQLSKSIKRSSEIFIRKS